MNLEESLEGASLQFDKPINGRENLRSFLTYLADKTNYSVRATYFVNEVCYMTVSPGKEQKERQNIFQYTNLHSLEGVIEDLSRGTKLFFELITNPEDKQDQFKKPGYFYGIRFPSIVEEKSPKPFSKEGWEIIKSIGKEITNYFSSTQ